MRETLAIFAIKIPKLRTKPYMRITNGSAVLFATASHQTLPRICHHGFCRIHDMPYVARPWLQAAAVQHHKPALLKPHNILRSQLIIVRLHTCGYNIRNIRQPAPDLGRKEIKRIKACTHTESRLHRRTGARIRRDGKKRQKPCNDNYKREFCNGLDVLSYYRIVPIKTITCS